MQLFSLFIIKHKAVRTIANADVPLNDEQQKFVEANHNLIYAYAHKHNLDLDEYYDILAIALCHAALRYDPSKGLFSTYAYRAMRNEVYMYWRDNYVLQKVIPQDMLISYNVILTEKLEALDTVSYQAQKDLLRETYGLDISYLFIKEKFKKLNTREQFIVLRSALGYKQTEIAQELKISRAQVCRILKKIKKKWMEDDRD